MANYPTLISYTWAGRPADAPIQTLLNNRPETRPGPRLGPRPETRPETSPGTRPETRSGTRPETRLESRRALKACMELMLVAPTEGLFGLFGILSVFRGSSGGGS